MVSIITPTWNRRELLRETIASVRAQTFSDWEHVIVDDGSDDGTPEMVAEIGAKDPRIRYVKRECEKKGANVCRNLGLRESRGEFLVFLDSDDLLAPECLEKRVKVMQRNLDLDFAVFNGHTFNEQPGDSPLPLNCRVWGDDLDRFVALQHPWIITGPIWSREFFQGLGGWNEDLKGSQDLDLHIRALAKRPRYLRFEQIDHDIRWAIDPERISAKKGTDPNVIESAGMVVHEWHRVLTETRNLSPQRERCLAGAVFHSALVLASAGFVDRATRLWKAAVLIHVPIALIWQGNCLLWVCHHRPVQGSRTESLIRRWKSFYGFELSLQSRVE